MGAPPPPKLFSSFFPIPSYIIIAVKRKEEESLGMRLTYILIPIPEHIKLSLQASTYMTFTIPIPLGSETCHLHYIKLCIHMRLTIPLGSETYHSHSIGIYMYIQSLVYSIHLPFPFHWEVRLTIPIPLVYTCIYKA